MECERILRQYQVKDYRRVYYDKNLDETGIDYQNFIRLKFMSINNKEIKNKYTIDGWYLLWYLMSNAHQSLYIKTSVNLIEIDTGISKAKIINSLRHLKSIEEIAIEITSKKDKNKTKTINNVNECDLLEISIKYNYGEISGYQAVPVEFIKSVLPTLKPQHWAIFTVLLVKHSYYNLTQYIDNATQVKYIGYTVNHYAFPTNEQIGDIIGLKESAIRYNMKELVENPYKLVSIVDIEKTFTTKKNKDGRNIIQRYNTRYKIRLLDRYEYNYYHVYVIPESNTDPAKKKARNEIIKSGFCKSYHYEDLNSYLINKDYISEFYKEEMQEYERILKEKDYHTYNNKKGNMKLNENKYDSSKTFTEAKLKFQVR